jgi:hypothetical protein
MIAAPVKKGSKEKKYCTNGKILPPGRLPEITGRYCDGRYIAISGLLLRETPKLRKIRFFILHAAQASLRMT